MSVLLFADSEGDSDDIDVVLLYTNVDNSICESTVENRIKISVRR